MIYIVEQTVPPPPQPPQPPQYLFPSLKRIIFIAQFVDVNSVSILHVEHQVPGLPEHLLTLTALQVNFFAVGCFFLKACNK